MYSIDNCQLSNSAIEAETEFSMGGRKSDGVVDEKTWTQRAQARLRQIKLGKSRPEYSRYVAEIPRESRTASHPSTPDPYERISKRQFDHLLSAWRRKLHDYDEEQPSAPASRANLPALSLSEHLGLESEEKEKCPKPEVMSLSLADHLAEHLEPESTSSAADSLFSSWPPSYFSDSFGFPGLSREPFSERSTSASEPFSSSSSSCDMASPTDTSPIGDLWSWANLGDIKIEDSKRTTWAPHLDDIKIEDSQGQTRILSSI